MIRKKYNVPSQESLFKINLPEIPEYLYSDDKPNQHLRAFIEAHLKENPFLSEHDKYNIYSFNRPIESTKATSIYNLHTYWSKKPHDAVRQYIKHYSKEKDLVLDPMCGSGGTALAALMENRKAIAIDLSPAATFITKNYCAPINPTDFKKELSKLIESVQSDMNWLYGTLCDRCGEKANIAFVVYSQTFICPRCMDKIIFFDCIDEEGRTAKGKPKKIKACPNCIKKGIVEEISTRSKRLGAVPVLVNYFCEGGCIPKRDERHHKDSNKTKKEYFEKYDLALLNKIDQQDIPYWYPTHRMMHAPEDHERWGVKWRAGTSNFRTVDELFTKQNLWALSTIRNYASKSKYAHEFLFCLTAICLSMSRMYLWGPKDEHGIIKGTYYMPQLSRSQNVLDAFVSKSKTFLAAKSVTYFIDTRDCIISTQSATYMKAIFSNSVDYIFTDPPYADNIQYGELNFIWEAWLNFDTKWHDKEIIVNDIRGIGRNEWANLMTKAMSECYRVLKPGRWLSLCFHHTDPYIWELTQDIMAEIGFLVDKSDSAIFINTEQKSFNQLLADKVSKRDLIINFRKPKHGETASNTIIKGDEDKTSFNEKVWLIINDYLTHNPGSTKDRIYDEVVSRMVRSGRMQAHNFEELLNQVAEEVKQPVMKDLFTTEDPNLFGTHEIGRWYIKETDYSIVDAAESSKEDTAAEKISVFIKNYLKKNPEREGVHYSDVFEQYVYTVKDKTRRSLADWLPDYFFKTDEGTWRLPQSEQEEKLKVEGRTKGINRRIKRYLAFTEQGVNIPENYMVNDITLSEWIRHCKRSGLYNQGKILYERGGLSLDKLPEDVMVNVEEDYQVCVRMIERRKM